MKDISEKLIDKCFDEIDDEDYKNTILKIAEQYFSSQKGLKVYQKKMKTTKYLMSRGFEYEEIKEVLDDFTQV